MVWMDVDVLYIISNFNLVVTPGLCTLPLSFDVVTTGYDLPFMAGYVIDVLVSLTKVKFYVTRDYYRIED